MRTALCKASLPDSACLLRDQTRRKSARLPGDAGRAQNITGRMRCHRPDAEQGVMRVSVRPQELKPWRQGRTGRKAVMASCHAIIQKPGDQLVAPGPAAIDHGIGIKAGTAGKPNLMGVVILAVDAGHKAGDKP